MDNICQPQVNYLLNESLRFISYPEYALCTHHNILKLEVFIDKQLSMKTSNFHRQLLICKMQVEFRTCHISCNNI
jgi:5'(3')-deoxyribonucleotidase